jgi:hypothetical protein
MESLVGQVLRGVQLVEALGLYSKEPRPVPGPMPSCPRKHRLPHPPCQHERDTIGTNGPHPNPVYKHAFLAARQIGALLRRERVYSSLMATWRNLIACYFNFLGDGAVRLRYVHSKPGNPARESSTDRYPLTSTSEPPPRLSVITQPATPHFAS